MKRTLIFGLVALSLVVLAQQLKPSRPSGTVAQIECQSNYMDSTVTFTVAEEGSYQVFCTAELLQELYPEYLQGDCIQYFFDVKHERLKAFSSKSDDRVYSIGKAADTTKAYFKIKQTGPRTYVMEAKVSWEKMGKTPKTNDVMGFDVAFSDNDGYGRATQLTWHAYDSELWINTSLFGRIQFVKDTQNLNPNDSTTYCVYSGTSPSIDGAIEPVWSASSAVALNRVVLGKLDSPLDCQAKFRTIWNETGLYLLAEITDDKVAFAPGPVYVRCDHGWIQNSQGQKVWEVDVTKSKPAGGADKNRLLVENIRLKPGTYTLHYVSDEGHSPKLWDDTPPKGAFYGIRLSKQ